MTVEMWLQKRIEEARVNVDLPFAVELWDGTRIPPDSDAVVTLRLVEPGAMRYLRRPSLTRLGEAFIEGLIDIDGPIDAAVSVAKGLSAGSAPPHQGRLSWLRNLHNRRRDAKSIRYHYDLSNDFYALWLDRQMVYSCAYFRDGYEDIHTAQEQKLDHICRKLRLQPGDRLLDIGCGWGALVCWASRHYGVDATGITLSPNQLAYAEQRIRDEGLSDRCRVRLQDYRDVPGAGQFDKVASIGMFEHVGLKNLPRYFATIHRLLRDGGIALNHGITSCDTSNRTVGMGGSNFIERYVFPNGELPRLSTVIAGMHDSGLEVMDVETLRLHYVHTLRHWSRALDERLDEARRHIDERRLRIWRVYLAGCANAFEQRWISIQQVLGVKSENPVNSPLPLSRAYLYSDEGGQ